MRAFASDHFTLPLPDKHRFPMAKYRLLRERVEAELPQVSLHEAPAADDVALGRAHDPAYVQRVADGALDPRELRALGFPWSPALVARSRRSAGATVAAAWAALDDGVAVNLAGGTHHAGVAQMHGYCVFNDAAVAARALQAAGAARRVLVIDTDVHQGDGTARIFADDPSVFTLSLHGARNFPFDKAVSDLDVPLPDGTDDATYLAALDHALDQALARFTPDLAIWVSGADPLAEDALGRLALTLDGLAARDRRVLSALAGVPIAATMAGGYAPDVGRIVAAHLQTVRLCAQAARR